MATQKHTISALLASVFQSNKMRSTLNISYNNAKGIGWFHLQRLRLGVVA
jgi:hypothetical protein